MRRQGYDSGNARKPFQRSKVHTYVFICSCLLFPGASNSVDACTADLCLIGRQKINFVLLNVAYYCCLAGGLYRRGLVWERIFIKRSFLRGSWFERGCYQRHGCVLEAANQRKRGEFETVAYQREGLMIETRVAY